MGIVPIIYPEKNVVCVKDKISKPYQNSSNLPYDHIYKLQHMIFSFFVWFF